MLEKSKLALSVSPYAFRYKNIALALLFTAILGPVGLLYASFWGGILMIVLGIIVGSCKLFFPMLLIWIISCIWGVAACERHNKKIFTLALQANAE
jgi:hypothetical protein